MSFLPTFDNWGEIQLPIYGEKKSYNFIALKIIFFQCTLDGYVHVTETIFGMENTCIRLESNKISVSIINKK